MKPTTAMRRARYAEIAALRDELNEQRRRGACYLCY